LIVLTVSAAGTAFAQFETRAKIPTASSPFAAAVGDFNRDGKLDMATANNNLQVFLGNGDGTFQAPVNYLEGAYILSVAAADLNHDGKLDLVVTDLLGLVVLMGNGDGSFQTGKTYPAPCGPYFANVRTGDFNGDHKLDLIVTYSSGDCLYVGVLLGNGDGTFQEPPINTSTSLSTTAIGIGDFNRDGKQDVVVADSTTNQVEILLSNGDGTFSPGAIYSVGSFPLSLAVVDLRRIGNLDLAVGTLFGGVNVLLGNGDATFQTAAGIGVKSVNSIISADFNGDGKPDLAVSQDEFPSGVSVITGNGDGSFQLPKYYPTGVTNRFVASGDFNGDHQTDLVASAHYSETGIDEMTVLLNTGVVTFSPTTPVNFPFQLVDVISPTQSVSLTNTGATALSISSITVDRPFHQTNNCGTSVAPGAKCAIKITFKPPTTANFAGILTIVDSASSKPQVIPVSGAGTVVGLSPTKLIFPPQKLGTTSDPMQVQVTNTGSTALAFTTNFYIDGTNYRDFAQTNNCGTHLLPGASCTVKVAFTPKNTGSRSAYVGMNDTGGGSPQSIPLSGTGD
jgi:hypothetical protein